MKQNITIVFSSVQFSHSVVSYSLRPHGLQHARSPYPSQLPEFTQTHVHWIGDAIQPSHPLSSPSPPALNLSQHQGLFQRVGSSRQVAKVLEFQLQHQFFHRISVPKLIFHKLKICKLHPDHETKYYHGISTQKSPFTSFQTITTPHILS